MAKPLVAIVGRPNVGKSTLVNRLAATRRAIVDESPGVTRDRNYIETDWRGQEFTLIDTGGIEVKGIPLKEAIKEQALAAVREADLILFVVEGPSGVTAGDREVADILRRNKKPILMIVNKADQPEQEELKYPFYELGLNEPFLVSALHGIGIGDLLDKVVALLPVAPRKEVLEVLPEEVKVAIVGRPNVGKSSLLNKLVGEKRAVVSEVPGTTRDAIDVVIDRSQTSSRDSSRPSALRMTTEDWYRKNKVNGHRYRFIDTAGLRKLSRLATNLEYYGILRTVRLLESADIALLVVDASEGVTEQDQKIAALIEEKNCAVIILANKWDLLSAEKTKDFNLSVHRRLHFLSYALLLKTSALTGRGLKEIYPAIDLTFSNFKKKIPTSALNEFLEKLRRKHLPSRTGKSLKLKYGTQLREAPPTFLFFVNDPKIVDNAYKRYLERVFREGFDFQGTPINFYFRKGK